MSTKREHPDFLTRVHNIPCGVVIDSYLSVPHWRGPIEQCPSDLDYYGYNEIEYHIIDRRGYPAPWLERLMTADDKARIYDEICKDRQSIAADFAEYQLEDR